MTATTETCAKIVRRMAEVLDMGDIVVMLAQGRCTFARDNDPSSRKYALGALTALHFGNVAGCIENAAAALQCHYVETGMVPVVMTAGECAQTVCAILAEATA